MRRARGGGSRRASGTGVAPSLQWSSLIFVTPALCRGPPEGKRVAGGSNAGCDAKWTPEQVGGDSWGERIALSRQVRSRRKRVTTGPTGPRNQKGASVSASPPVSPSARLPIRETGALRRRQAWFHLPARDMEPCSPAIAKRPLVGHRDGGGSEEPQSRLDVLAIPSCLAAFRHRGPVIDRHDP